MKLPIKKMRISTVTFGRLNNQNRALRGLGIIKGTKPNEAKPKDKGIVTNTNLVNN